MKGFFAKPRHQRLPREVAWVYELLRRYGSIDYARQVAVQFAEAALTEFESAYQGASGTDDLEFLRHLLDYMVKREV